MSYSIGYNKEVIKGFQRRKAQEKASFIFPYLKDDYKLLDIGQGPGTISCDLAEILIKGSVTGIDKETTQVQIAKNEAESRGLSNCKFVVSDAKKLPFKDDSFDIVYTNATLWSIDEIQTVFTEIKRVVKNDGLIACREIEYSSLISFPESPIIKRCEKLFAKGLTLLGSDLQMGRKLKKHLLEISATILSLTGSFDVYEEKEDLNCLVNFSISSWENSPWSHELRKRGLINDHDIKEIINALKEWEKDPNTFQMTPWVQVLAKNKK